MLNICTVCPHSALYSQIFGKFIEATQSEQSIVIIHLHTNNISIQCRIDYCLVSGLLMIDFARVFIRFYKKVESQTTNMDLFVIFFYTNSKKNTRNEFHYGIWWMVWCVVYERNYTYPSQNIYSFFFLNFNIQLAHAQCQKYTYYTTKNNNYTHILDLFS